MLSCFALVGVLVLGFLVLLFGGFHLWVSVVLFFGVAGLVVCWFGAGFCCFV